MRVREPARGPYRVALLVDEPDLIGAVGTMRCREWGNITDPGDLSRWVAVTARESGRETLPITWVAADPRGRAAGAVGVGEFDPPERRDRSPWVLGMVVDTQHRGQGVGRLLLSTVDRWATGGGHRRLWVATGGAAVAFYQRCGWRPFETFPRADGEVTVLVRDLGEAEA